MKIEKVNINQIKPYWRNPRKNEKAIPIVKESIEKYGYNQPIVVDKDYVIIAGHTRYKALRQLDYEKIQVVVKNIDEDLAKQYRIADNKSSEKSQWDEDKLLFELREIEEIDDMEAFFTESELERILDLDDEEDYEYDDENFSPSMSQGNIQSATISGNENFENNINTDNDIDSESQPHVSDFYEQERERENESIQEMQREEQDRFRKQTNEREDDYIRVQCPHCDEIYTLSKFEITKRSKIGLDS